MRRFRVVAAAALLTACSAAHDTASCSPCPGPGFVEVGLPSTTGPAVVRTCVDDEPCQTQQVDRAPQPMSLEYVPLVRPADWPSYDGKLITVTVRIAGQRWQGGAGLVYAPGEGGTCSCAGLVAQVLFTRVG